MWFSSWLTALLVPTQPQRSGPRKRTSDLRSPQVKRLLVEGLEDRRLLTFLPAVSYPTGVDSPEAVATADFNNDGQLDLAIASNRYDPDALIYIGTVSVLLGNADGTFQPAIHSLAGNQPTSLAVGDFNSDGKLDLATATYAADSVSADVTVLLGNGNGSFQAPAVIDLGSEPSDPVSVSVGDFNADGKLDICALNNFWVHYYDGINSYVWSYGAAHVLLGTGTGTFGSPMGSTIGEFGDYITSAIVEDFNGDGKLDIAATGSYGQAYVALGTGSYFQNDSYDLGGSSIVASDLNHDGKVDLAAAGESSVSVLPGNGNGSFGTAQTYYVGSEWIFDLAVADVSGDGKHDLIAPNLSNNGTVSVLLGTEAGAFTPPVTAAVGAWPAGVAVGDFNGDGWLDAATANYAGTVSVLINDRSWPSPPPPPPPPPPSVTINDVTATEGNTGTTNATFRLTLSSATNVDVTVHYATADGSALAGTDYVGGTGDLVIPAGQTSATVTVAVMGDRLVEPTESFAVNLTGATGATIGDGQGTGDISDDEPRVSIGDATKREGRNGKTTLLTFTVTLSVLYDQPVTMSFQTVNGTATTSDNDYVAKTGTLTFAPGETTKTITIVVKGDSKKEASETFYLDLSGLSSNALFTKNRGIGSILNDD